MAEDKQQTLSQLYSLRAGISAVAIQRNKVEEVNRQTTNEVDAINRQMAEEIRNLESEIREINKDINNHKKSIEEVNKKIDEENITIKALEQNTPPSKSEKNKKILKEVFSVFIKLMAFVVSVGYVLLYFLVFRFENVFLGLVLWALMFVFAIGGIAFFLFFYRSYYRFA